MLNVISQFMQIYIDYVIVFIKLSIILVKAFSLLNIKRDSSRSFRMTKSIISF